MKKENSKRFLPNQYLHNFTTTYLPNKKNFFVTDIDLVFRDRSNNMMLVEVKCKNRCPSRCQATTYHIFHACFLNSNNKPLVLAEFNLHKWRYYGYHLLQFENSTFENGKVYFNGKEVSKEELINKLSFKSNDLKLYASNG